MHLFSFLCFLLPSSVLYCACGFFSYKFVSLFLLLVLLVLFLLVYPLLLLFSDCFFLFLIESQPPAQNGVGRADYNLNSFALQRGPGCLSSRFSLVKKCRHGG